MSAALVRVQDEQAEPIPSAHRPIAALPALDPKTLLANPMVRRHFPFSDARTEYFYLARGAVWHAVKRLGLDGAEVLVPAYHHGVEVEALVDAGVRPRFFNVHRDFKIDLADLASRITPETKAIYVIHYAGFPQPMDDILSIARARRLKVIEDCALSLFSSQGFRPLGARGDAAIFCLYKTLPVPHGGALWMPAHWEPVPLKGTDALTTAHQLASSLMFRLETSGHVLGRKLRSGVREVAQAVRALATLPVDSRPVGHRNFIPGQQHLGMSPFFRRVALNLRAETIIEQRRRNYYALLGRLRDLVPPMVHELESGVSPLFYPLWCEDKRGVQARLAAQGVETIDFWSAGSPLVPAGKFPEVDDLREHVLELPIHQDLEAADIEVLAAAVRGALKARRSAA
jgi:hypothetical protein